MFVIITFADLPCNDTLPSDYDHNKCPWDCIRWSDSDNSYWVGHININSYCDRDWSEYKHCVPYSTGKVREYCKKSCSNCGKIFFLKSNNNIY